MKTPLLKSKDIENLCKATGHEDPVFIEGVKFGVVLATASVVDLIANDFTEIAYDGEERTAMSVMRALTQYAEKVDKEAEATAKVISMI